MVGQIYAQIENAFRTLNPVNPSFWVMGYKDSNGGESNFRFALMGYLEAVRQSLAELRQMDVSNFSELQRQAYDEIEASLCLTLDPRPGECHQRHETLEAAGKRFISANISYIPASDKFYFEGLVTKKQVIVPATYPEKKSRPLTIEKNKIRRQLTVGKYRTLLLSPEEIGEMVKYDGGI